MRLIDVDTLEIKFFSEKNVPEYAILSHTWGGDEITFQEMSLITRMRSLTALSKAQTSDPSQNTVKEDGSTGAGGPAMLAAVEMLVRGSWGLGMGLPDVGEEALMQREGYSKIVFSAREAKNLGYQWIWIDTCCIDKTSSAELQESINSMFKWYQESSICLVYLNDVEPSESQLMDTQATSEAASSAFQNNRWITRGWTLQELVAPKSLRFYFKDWSLMGDKSEFIEELSNATGIPIFVLDNGDLSELSLAERMSWASYRQTTRLEDMAYCLLGIFDIQMPLLYGEGEKAFIRLQEEILKTTDDYSLFAWRAVAPSSHPPLKSTYRGLLARSPLEFRDCGAVERETGTCIVPTTSTPIGLHLSLEFLTDPKDKSRFLAMIRCNNHMNQRLAIYLKCLDGANQYARVDASRLVPIDNWPSGQPRTIYVRQKPSIPPDFFTPEMLCFYVQRRVSDRAIPAVRIASVFPPANWNPATQQLAIPPSSLEFLAVLFLRGQASPYGASTEFQVVLGFDRRSKHYFCKAVQCAWPALSADRGRWRTAIRKVLPMATYDPLMKNDVRHDIFVVGDTELGINVSIRAGMCDDNVALQVLIDGLVKGR